MIVLSVLFVPFGMAKADDGGPERVFQTYVVRKGDTVARIARRFHVTPRAIRRANHLKTSRLKPGQRLQIPLSKRLMKRSSYLCNAYYRVRPGDTLGAIARHCNVPQKRLQAVNHLAGAQRLWVGQRLRIPGGKPEHSRDYLPVPGH